MIVGPPDVPGAGTVMTAKEWWERGTLHPKNRVRHR